MHRAVVAGIWIIGRTLGGGLVDHVAISLAGNPRFVLHRATGLLAGFALPASGWVLVEDAELDALSTAHFILRSEPVARTEVVAPAHRSGRNDPLYRGPLSPLTAATRDDRATTARAPATHFRAGSSRSLVLVVQASPFLV